MKVCEHIFVGVGAQEQSIAESISTKRSSSVLTEWMCVGLFQTESCL